MTISNGRSELPTRNIIIWKQYRCADNKLCDLVKTNRCSDRLRSNGGPRGCAGRRQLSNGDGKVENDSGRQSQQENYLARCQVLLIRVSVCLLGCRLCWIHSLANTDTVRERCSAIAKVPHQEVWNSDSSLGLLFAIGLALWSGLRLRFGIRLGIWLSLGEVLQQHQQVVQCHRKHCRLLVYSAP